MYRILDFFNYVKQFTYKNLKKTNPKFTFSPDPFISYILISIHSIYLLSFISLLFCFSFLKYIPFECINEKMVPVGPFINHYCAQTAVYSMSRSVSFYNFHILAFLFFGSIFFYLYTADRLERFQISRNQQALAKDLAKLESRFNRLKNDLPSSHTSELDITIEIDRDSQLLDEIKDYEVLFKGSSFLDLFFSRIKILLFLAAKVTFIMYFCGISLDSFVGANTSKISESFRLSFPLLSICNFRS